MGNCPAGTIKLLFRKLNSISCEQRRQTQSERPIDIAKTSVKPAGAEHHIDESRAAARGWPINIKGDV
jgi:hypothetical protein